MKKCYYAHPMYTYHSNIENEDIMMLKAMGFEVINPSDPEIVQGCNDYIRDHGNGFVMDFFKNIIDDCDVLAFRGNPDGTITSGIVTEIEHAKYLNLPVIEIPVSIERRSLSYKETSIYLKEVGFK